MKITPQGIPVGGVAEAGVWVGATKIKSGGTATVGGDRVYYQGLDTRLHACELDGSLDTFPACPPGISLIVAASFGVWAAWTGGSSPITVTYWGAQFVGAVPLAATEDGAILLLTSYSTGTGLRMVAPEGTVWDRPNARPVVLYPYPQAFALDRDRVVYFDTAAGKLVSIGLPPAAQVQDTSPFDPFLMTAPDGAVWLGYHTHDDRAVLHPLSDGTRGYVLATGYTFGTTATGSWFGYSRDAGETQMVVAQVDWSQPTVSLVPVPSIPLGPMSPSSPAGTVVDLRDYILGDSALFPRGGTAEGNDLPGQHYMHLSREPVQSDGTERFHWIKFAPNLSGGRNLETWAFTTARGNQPAFLHGLADQSNHPKVVVSTDTRFAPRVMRTGLAHAWDSGIHEAETKSFQGCFSSGRGDFERWMWCEHYARFSCGPDLGERPVVALVYDPTGGHHYSYAEAVRRGLYANDRGIEVFYFALGAGWFMWEYYNSLKAMAHTPPRFDDTTIMRGDDRKPSRSLFYSIGGPVMAPVLSACIPSPTMPPEIPPVTTRDRLKPGELLRADAPLVSQDKRFQLLYQSDGNLVLYGPRGPLWSTGTNGQSVGFCAMQGDGNFVLYNKAGQPRWASNTNGSPGAWLLVQNDGNLVIYRGAQPVWASNTVYQPLPPIPPGPVTPDMHAWPKFGASYQTGLTNPDCDPQLWASLNRDAGGDLTRIWAVDAWAIGPNGPGQYHGLVPWHRDSAGVFDLTAPNRLYDDRLNAYVRAQNAAGATVQITTLELYSWSDRKQGLLWVPDQNLGPFRKNKNGVRWGNPDDPTFFTLPDWVLAQLIERICTAVRGLAVCFEIGNEMPEKAMHERIEDALRSNYTNDWQPDISINRQDDTPGQYHNMRIGTNYDRIAFHGKDALTYLDEDFPREPVHRTFRSAWADASIDPKRVIMSSDGCRVNNTIDCYDWDTLRDVARDHLRRGFTFEHQSRVKMRTFIEGRLDLVTDFEGAWLRSLR